VKDYETRGYLSAIEGAKYLGITVSTLHNYVRQGKVRTTVSASGQQRFDLADLRELAEAQPQGEKRDRPKVPVENVLDINGTVQRILVKDAASMGDIADDSVHLMITSPPYFNAKLYSREPVEGDLGNIHDINDWFENISMVWAEVYRVLQPGRKAFINIMNLPVRTEQGFRSLNLVGRTIDVMEGIGFIFKRDIVWHKTNAVRAHFGSYPYPGGILINNMHEFIVEFDKPARKGYRKYTHVTKEQREQSKLDKEFWLSIKNSDVWVMHPEKSGDGRSHVAPFPIELPLRLIKAFTYVGETILDPFVGSGTTLLAAARLARNGIGYEIVPSIARTALTRVSNIQLDLGV